MTADEALIVLVLEAKEKTKVFDGPDPLFLQVSCEAEKIFGLSPPQMGCSWKGG